jgi:hypothetical protein
MCVLHRLGEDFAMLCRVTVKINVSTFLPPSELTHEDFFFFFVFTFLRFMLSMINFQDNQRHPCIPFIGIGNERMSTGIGSTYQNS